MRNTFADSVGQRLSARNFKLVERLYHIWQTSPDFMPLVSFYTP